uniref:Uncharacterized protein n=1 Tax=mine drainage metagenome TaxID=410659 RepID=E6Q3D0_9ZZZZ
MSVPELPVASIRTRLRDAHTRHRSHVLIACALATIAVLGSGTLLAAMMFGGVRVWLSGDRAAVDMTSFALILNPNADDLRRVTTDATFPVVLPVGIPKGMHMNTLIFSPADHPNFIEVMYRNSQTDARSGQFLLLDSSTLNHGEAPTLPNGESLPAGKVTHWSVGRESVIVLGAGQYAAMKSAMSGITPAESLARTLPMLYRITLLAEQDKRADEAEAIAPAEGQSVLLDRGHLGDIARLARSNKPVVYTRETVFEPHPSVAGKPDFAHAKRHFITTTAVSAGGVRAIAAVLASGACGSTGTTRSSLTCQILINERSGRAYWIWVLPLNTSSAPTKYVVDSTTFRVLQRG